MQKKSQQELFRTEVKYDDLKDLNQEQKTTMITGIKRYISTGVKTLPAEKQQDVNYYWVTLLLQLICTLLKERRKGVDSDDCAINFEDYFNASQGKLFTQYIQQVENDIHIDFNPEINDKLQSIFKRIKKEKLNEEEKVDVSLLYLKFLAQGN